jgi:CRP-like cAMP-binding protein
MTDEGERRPGSGAALRPGRPQKGSNRLLDRLAPADFAVLQPHSKPLELRRGDVLYEARGAIERVYFPLSGMVSLLAVMRGGEMIETGMVGREGMVGASVIADNWQSFAQATVQIQGAALQIGSAQFVEACRASPRLAALAHRSQAVILLQAQQNAACHALHSIEARFARWMLQSQDVVESPEIELTQEFLSHMLGVQRTSVSLVAHTLQGAGLIRYTRGHITVVDRARLEACACECYAVIRGEAEKALSPAPVAAEVGRGPRL